MTKSNLRWCTVDAPKRKRIPKWALSAALDADGTVFVPAVIAGNEMMVMLCASYDGTSAVMDKEHLYFPANWIAQEFPKARETAETIQRNVRAFFKCES